MFAMARCDTILDGLQIVSPSLATSKRQFPYLSNLPDLEITPLPTTASAAVCMKEPANGTERELREKKMKFSSKKLILKLYFRFKWVDLPESL